MKEAKLRIYVDLKGEWRWRLSVNGRIMADSAEGYSSRSNVKRALRSLVGRMWVEV